MPVDPEGLLADWERRVQQQTMLTAELSQRIEQIKATVTSPGGEVAVTVDSSGGLADLRLTQRAMRLPADDLASLILNSSRRAQSNLAQQVTEVTSGICGAGSETAAFISGVYSNQFPAHPGEEKERGR